MRIGLGTMGLKSFSLIVLTSQTPLIICACACICVYACIGIYMGVDASANANAKKIVKAGVCDALPPVCDG